MRALLENTRTGEVATYEVPQPELRAGGILVRTAFSAISSGTEREAAEFAEKSLIARAMARPDLVKQVIQYARSNGIKAAYTKVQTRLDALTVLGYSCSGTVIGVGEGVDEFRCGDRVACGGPHHASHCEVNWIPRNLAVRVPESVPLEVASFTSIGAIALQGIRQAKVVLGETVAIIGAGLVGVLTIQLARAAGCRVIAVDLDPSRVDKARSFGAHLALQSNDPRLQSAIDEFSRYGADAAIVTAATRSSEPLELAAKVLREQGRIVVVGDVGMDIPRRSVYRKELTLAMSRSYGPGRYDPNYEEVGNDYPVAYVRWTERRNMEAFLDFSASGAIDLSPLLERRYLVEEAASAYAELLAGKGYTAILDYGAAAPTVRAAIAQVIKQPSDVPGRLRVGCIGAGGFAQGFIFPNLKRENVLLESVATASGVAAESARRNFGFARAQTAEELLHDPTVDAVFITSWHSSHAAYAVTALQQGKMVFVEKPLAINRQQVHLVQAAYEELREAGKPAFVMVGFNRRFAPASLRVKQFFEGRQEPMLAQIRIHAGFVPREQWVQQPGEGGRIIGELCHFVDWARWLIGSPIRTFSVSALPDGRRYSRDNVTATLACLDGSIANVVYLANGDPSVPKERYEIFCEGAVARIEDFEFVELVRNRKAERFKSSKDKGHRRELQLTVGAMASGGQPPIAFDEIVEVTETTISIDQAIASGHPVCSSPTDVAAEVVEASMASGVDGNPSREQD